MPSVVKFPFGVMPRREFHDPVDVGTVADGLRAGLGEHPVLIGGRQRLEVFVGVLDQAFAAGTFQARL